MKSKYKILIVACLLAEIAFVCLKDVPAKMLIPENFKIKTRIVYETH